MNDENKSGTAPLRLWPAWVIAVGVAVALVLSVTSSIPNRPRFLIMMASPLVGGIVFSGWVLFASRLRWREKLGIALAGLVLPVISGAISVSDSALRTTMWTNGVPLAIFLVTIGLTVSAKNPRRAIIATVLLALGWGSFALVRNDGFDGDYYPEFAWRWSPIHEETLPALPAATSGSEEPATATADTSAPMTTPEWGQFRGPAGTGVVDDLLEVTDWKANPPRELWRIQVGPGWSSFAFHNDRLFTQEQRGDNEYVTCYSATNGELLWSHSDSSRFTEVVSGAGPRSTPAVHDGRVYALGGRGLLNCLNELSGELIWQRDFVKEFEAPVPMWGFSGSPVIVENKVILFAGGKGMHGLIAVDALTGETQWAIESPETNYSTARLLTLADIPQLLFCDGRGIHGLKPADGQILWSYRPADYQGPAMVDPQPVTDNRILVSLGDGIGVTCLEVGISEERWKITEVWTSKRLRPSFNDSVVVGDSIFGFNQAIFSCIDANTGERRWNAGRYGFGQAIALKNSQTIIVAAENGDAVFLKAGSDKLEEQLRIPVLEDKTWNHPIVVGNRLFMRNGKVAVCLQLCSNESQLANPMDSPDQTAAPDRHE